MGLFRTESVKVTDVRSETGQLVFALTERHEDVVKYIRGESYARFKKRSSTTLAATLRFLYQEGQLHISDLPSKAAFHIPFDQLYRIPETTLKKLFGIKTVGPLELRPPPHGQFALLISSRGDDPQSDTFKVIPEIRYQGRVVSRTLIDGPLISTRKDSFALMPSAAWRCLCQLSAADQEVSETPLARSYHLMAVAQEFAKYDYIRPDSFIRSNIVSSPKTVALTLDRDNNEFICRLHPEGVPREAFEAAFDRHGTNIPAAYSIQTDSNTVTRVFFDKAARTQLQQVAGKRRIKEGDVRSLLEDPAKFLGLPEQSDFWNLSELSSRVAGWGVFVADDILIAQTTEKAHDSVFVTFASKTSLDTDTLDASLLPLERAGLSEEELEAILASLDDAIASAKPLIVLPHTDVTVTEDRYQTFRERIEAALYKLRKKAFETDSEKMHLLSKSNADEVVHANAQSEQAKRAKDLFTSRGLPAAIRENLPSGRPVVVHPHQQDGISWLLSLYQRSRTGDVGCLLADDMGLGKTFQVIAFLASLAESESPGPTLVVCPTTLRQNWESEIKMFVKESAGWDVQVLVAGMKSPPELSDRTIVITNYEQVYARHRDFFMKTSWKCVFMDEAQKFKNPGGRLHNYLRALKSPFKVAMTGTPVENRLLDLWSLFDVVHPGLLGHRAGFISTFEQPLKDLAPGSAERLALREQLEALMGAHFLRRIKSEIPTSKLPKITYHDPSYCPMSEYQRRLYDTVVASGLNGSLQFLSAMMGLLMISSHPAAYDASLLEQEPDELIALSTKLKRCVQMLKGIKERGEKVIIFEKYLSIQHILSVAIETELEVDPLRINGEVAPEIRKGLISEWEKKPGFQVLVMSPRTGGAGLTIVSANHVIHFTREYNPAVEMQATDRVYRIGQNKDVEVHYPVSVPSMDTIDDSIELHLDRIQRYKRHIATDFTLPVGADDALQQPSSPEMSLQRPSKLSELFAGSRSGPQQGSALAKAFTEALEVQYGEDVEWQQMDVSNIYPDTTLLLNKQTGEGKVFYVASKEANRLPTFMEGNFEDLRAQQPFLRAIIAKTMVIDEDTHVSVIAERARTCGVSVLSVATLGNGFTS